MPIRRDKKWKQAKALVRQRVQQAVARAATILDQVISAELSKPGRGRMYARHAATRKIAGANGELSIAQVTKILAKENTRVAERRLAGKAPRGKTLRGLGVHRASAPGDPPAVDTGTLRRSVQPDYSGLNEPNPRSRTGTNLKYAKGLEYGTRRVAARPFMRPGARKARPKIKALFAARNLLAPAIGGKQ